MIKRLRARRDILNTARKIAHSHYRGEHPDLGKGWVITEQQMQTLRDAYGVFDSK